MRQHKRLILIILLSGILAVLSSLFGPAAAQRRGMSAAAAHRNSLTPQLKADPRYNGITLDITTHPGLLVRGTVADPRALDDLHRLIEVPNDPGFRVFMQALVAPPATTQSSEE